MRIGERLIALGVLDEAAVEEALGAQMAYGARLGTNLVELFHLDIDELAATLGIHHEMPAALNEDFERADPVLQAGLPAEVAARWHVVPLHRTEGEIVVAATDPIPDDAVDDLAGYLGGPVTLAVAPEVRVLFHLEKAYQVTRTNRFRRVHNPPKPRDARRRYVETLSDVDALPEPPSRLARIAVKKIALGLTGESDRPDDVTSVESAAKALRRATSRERLADLVVSALGIGFARRLTAGMILNARRDVLFGWKGFVREGERDLIEAVAVPLADPSAFRAPLAARRSYVGPPPDGGTPLDHKLWLLLGTGAPAQLAVVPLELRGRIAGAIYAQADDPIDDLIDGLGELADGLSAGFERLLRGEAR